MIQSILLAMTVSGALCVFLLGMVVEGGTVGLVLGIIPLLYCLYLFGKTIQLYFRFVREMK